MPFIAHSGLAVTDLERSTRFYTELLGFEPCRTLKLGPENVTDFLGLDQPTSLHAVYLIMGDFQLELLAYDPPATNRVRDRKMNEAGLTHLSIGVDSVPAVIERLAEYGGELVYQMGDRAAIIRDPDGQLTEILAGPYAAEERLRRGD